MTESYIDQLILLQEWLDSPHPDIVEEAYDSLFSLWLKYSAEIGFQQEVEKISRKHQRLAPEFTDRLNKLPCSEDEKAELLKVIVLLYQPQSPQEGLLSGKVIKAHKVTPKLFISYSHKDESFKNELLIMLAGLQRRGIIDIWQDRRIEPGSKWYDAIRKAIEECNVALLLISPDFIASRFIQEEELVKLFDRRGKENLRVVPIIVRSCLWKSEPIIKDIQALPKDGKPVISYSIDNGARDDVWAEIGSFIEDLAGYFIKNAEH